MKMFEFEFIKNDRTVARDREQFETIEEARRHCHKLMAERGQELGADMIHIRENGSKILETCST